MKIRMSIWALVLAVAGCISASAQTTTVSGTVIDPNGVRYSLGTINASMQLPSPAPSPVPALTSVTSTLDATGAFSMVLTSSQTYNFTACGIPPSIGPRGNNVAGVICFSVTNLAVSGATQDITANLINGPPAVLGGFSGLDYLGSTSCAANCQTTATLTFPARDFLIIYIRIASYQGSDIGSLRFNGDSGTNYWDRHITVATGGTTLTDVPTASTTLIRLAGNAVAQGRTVEVHCMNQLAKSKPCQITVQTLTGAAGTVGIMDFGGGEWVNTTAQITSLAMLTAGGSITMGSGTGFAVFGKNF